MNLEAIIDELRKSYFSVTSIPRCKELISSVLMDSDKLAKLGVNDIKIITKVACNVLEKDWQSFPGELTKIYNCHKIGITKAQRLEETDKRTSLTLQAHLYSHKGFVAHIQRMRTGSDYWADEEYKSYVQAASIMRETDRRFASRSYRHAAEAAKNRFFDRKNITWAKRWLECEVEVAEHTDDEKTKALCAYETGEAARQLYMKIHDKRIKELGLTAYQKFIDYCWEHPGSREEQRVGEANSKLRWLSTQ